MFTIYFWIIYCLITYFWKHKSLKTENDMNYPPYSAQIEKRRPTTWPLRGSAVWAGRNKAPSSAAPFLGRCGGKRVQNRTASLTWALRRPKSASRPSASPVAAPRCCKFRFQVSKHLGNLSPWARRAFRSICTPCPTWHRRNRSTGARRRSGSSGLRPNCARWAWSSPQSRPCRRWRPSSSRWPPSCGPRGPWSPRAAPAARRAPSPPSMTRRAAWK